jgi:hypothetical protein
VIETIVMAWRKKPLTRGVQLTFGTGTNETAIEFPKEGVTTSCPITKVGERRFRLDGIPPFAKSAGYQDIIEAEEIAENRLRFIRVAERSGWRTYTFVLTASGIKSDWGQTLLRELEAIGGHWEQVFGGLLFVCMPPDCDIDPTPSVIA